MKRVLLLTFFDQFDFPLHEAGRKQAWWMANKLKNNFKVDIFFHSSSVTSINIDAIKIFSGSFNSIDLPAYDEVRIIVSSLEFRLLRFVFCKNIKKTLYIYDGQPIPFDFKYPLRKLLAKTCSRLFDDVYILSEYQKKNLGIKNISKIDVYLPSIETGKYSNNKSMYPSILYMGHLKKFKGVKYLINCSYDLVKKYPDIKIIYAINGLHSDYEIKNSLNKLHSIYPSNIILKGIVDPLYELSKAWVYVYPFRQPHGTMAYALSIYEALKLDCGVIASDVGSNKEFFKDIRYLKKPSIFDKFRDVQNKLFEEICYEIENRSIS